MSIKIKGREEEGKEEEEMMATKTTTMMMEVDERRRKNTGRKYGMRETKTDNETEWESTRNGTIRKRMNKRNKRNEEEDREIHKEESVSMS